MNIPESLRPWHAMGLEFLLSSAPEAGISVGPVSGTGQSTAPAPRQAAPEVSSPRRPTPSPTSQKSQQQAQHQPVQNRQTSASPQSSASGTDMRQPPNPSSRPMPAPWDRFVAMASSTRPRVLLTYPELGFDLTGHSVPARGQLMRTLLSYLKWPKGTSAFWPCALPFDGQLQPQYEMFWRGVHHFACPHVVCFGMDAMRIVAPDFPQDTDTVLMEACTLHLVPSVDELMGKLPHELLLSVAGLAKLRV